MIHITVSNKSYKNSSVQYTICHGPFDSQCLQCVCVCIGELHTLIGSLLSDVWLFTDSAESQTVQSSRVQSFGSRSVILPPWLSCFRKQTDAPQIITVSPTGLLHVSFLIPSLRLSLQVSLEVSRRVPMIPPSLLRSPAVPEAPPPRGTGPLPDHLCTKPKKGTVRNMLQSLSRAERKN